MFGNIATNVSLDRSCSRKDTCMIDWKKQPSLGLNIPNIVSGAEFVVIDNIRISYLTVGYVFIKTLISFLKHTVT